MRRAATTVFLGGWIGFFAVSSATASLAILAVAEPGFPRFPWIGEAVDRLAASILAGGNADILATAVAACLSLTIAVLLGLAIWLVQGGEPEDRASGERVAFVGLAAGGCLVGILRLCGMSAFIEVDSLAIFAATVALSMLAVAFDRLVEIDDEDGEEDDADFRAATLLIGQGMAREAMIRAAVRDLHKRD